jgi:hypothetical protein
MTHSIVLPAWAAEPGKTDLLRQLVTDEALKMRRELAGKADAAVVPAVAVGEVLDPDTDPRPLYADVAAFLTKGLPDPPTPVLLTRDDGHALFYAAKVNVVYGDPESGKTWIALGASQEAMARGVRTAIIDLDHNGMAEIIGRLMMLGANPADLANPERFRLYEPDEQDELTLAVAELRLWRPGVVVVDSIGELLPMLGLSSNSPDDYTSAHKRVLGKLAKSGAAVIAIDHMPKGDDARTHGQTGTYAKKRAINGASYRVTLTEPFAPGRGGAASLTIGKDRPGGVRAHCPVDGKYQPAGRFIMTTHPDGTATWNVTTPRLAVTGDVPDTDIAELDGLLPPPTSQRDVMKRLGWGAHRALSTLQRWRDLRKPQLEDPYRSPGNPGATATPHKGG